MKHIDRTELANILYEENLRSNPNVDKKNEGTIYSDEYKAQELHEKLGVSLQESTSLQIVVINDTKFPLKLLKNKSFTLGEYEEKSNSNLEDCLNIDPYDEKKRPAVRSWTVKGEHLGMRGGEFAFQYGTEKYVSVFARVHILGESVATNIRIIQNENDFAAILDDPDFIYEAKPENAIKIVDQNILVEVQGFSYSEASCIIICFQEMKEVFYRVISENEKKVIDRQLSKKTDKYGADYIDINTDRTFYFTDYDVCMKESNSKNENDTKAVVAEKLALPLVPMYYMKFTFDEKCLNEIFKSTNAGRCTPLFSRNGGEREFYIVPDDLKLFGGNLKLEIEEIERIKDNELEKENIQETTFKIVNPYENTYHLIDEPIAITTEIVGRKSFKIVKRNEEKGKTTLYRLENDGLDDEDFDRWIINTYGYYREIDNCIDTDFVYLERTNENEMYYGYILSRKDLRIINTTDIHSFMTKIDREHRKPDMKLEVNSKTKEEEITSEP